jgi:hypothetical protein
MISRNKNEKADEKAVLDAIQAIDPTTHSLGHLYFAMLYALILALLVIAHRIEERP